MEELVQANTERSASSERSTEQFGVWQPIESAPKNRAAILIAGGTYSYSGECFPEDRTFTGVKTATWLDDHWFGGYGPEYDEFYRHEPTHWMPLPSPLSNDDRDVDTERAGVSVNQPTEETE